MEDSCELPTYIAISSCPVTTPGRSRSCRTGSKMRGGDRSDRGPAAHRVRLEKAEPAASRVLRSSRTSPNFRITVASPKWPIAASPLRLKATALRAFDEARICSLTEAAFSTGGFEVPTWSIRGDGRADDERAARVAGGNRGSQSSTCASRSPFATMSALTASRVSRPQAAMAWSAAASNSNGADRDGSRSRFTNPSLPKYGHFIPARDGADQALMLPIHPD
ncbi:hypothetical protein Bra1253DRAFT_01651 [Bradyrhizobium sp. WSM1253]|nr:hypothetical protein Bra1253DRAFT_01651 [Bradyrhizobium sp. WSM1253]